MFRRCLDTSPDNPSRMLDYLASASSCGVLPDVEDRALTVPCPSPVAPVSLTSFPLLPVSLWVSSSSSLCGEFKESGKGNVYGLGLGSERDAAVEDHRAVQARVEGFEHGP